MISTVTLLLFLLLLTLLLCFCWLCLPLHRMRNFLDCFRRYAQLAWAWELIVLLHPLLLFILDSFPLLLLSFPPCC